jgi:1-acyl-sn-glycerol-3-phosphate acyltransferase
MAEPLSEPITDTPHPTPLYWLLRGILGMSLLGIKIHIVGRENIPDGKAIIAPNHTSNWDPPLVGTTLPIPMHFVAKSQMFKPVIGWLLQKGLTHPVRREGSDTQAIRKFKAILKSDQKLVMFPEGTRSRDGKLQPFKSGVATLAMWTGAPIVPVAIQGARELWPPGQPFPKFRGSVQILIGQPIYPSGDSSKHEIERLNALTHDAIQKLLDTPFEG